MDQIDERKIKHIIASLKNLEYGSVVITVHGGEITQIDTTEKMRYPVLKSRPQEAKK
jgi:hypothetical protein